MKCSRWADYDRLASIPQHASDIARDDLTRVLRLPEHGASHNAPPTYVEASILGAKFFRTQEIVRLSVRDGD